MVNRKQICDRAESAASDALRAEGFSVVNLNSLAGNCPFMDLLAIKDSDRLLVQVKGTTTQAGKFGAPPDTAQALVRFAAALECQSIYAFVQLRDQKEPIIRWAHAEGVAAIAAEAVRLYDGILRYHVFIDEVADMSIVELVDSER